MRNRLEGKTVFITGAATGIGAASARLFASEGASLILADIDEQGVAAVAASLQAEGSDASAVAVDLTDENSVAAAFESAVAPRGRLDALFNCAGGSTASDGTVEALTSAVWDATFKLEVESAANCSRSAIPYLRAAGGGAIVNMSSFAAYRGTVRIHAYAAAKGAVSALTRAMAGSYASEGIRVNAIAPGVALSERARRRIAEPNVAAELTFDWASYPFAMGEPEDIAAVALFLTSDDSRMITGQTIMADGGLTAY